MTAIHWIVLTAIVLWLINRSSRQKKPKDDGVLRTGLPIAVKSGVSSAIQPTNPITPKATEPIAQSLAQTEAITPRPDSSADATTRRLSDMVTVELVLEGRSSPGVPIPARTPKVRNIKVGNGETFKAELSPYGTRFVELADKYVDKVSGPVEHVPFKAYWSTYAHMDASQTSWYYFWRNEIRNGRYPPTDLSYIFIHIYECLHGVGFDTILQAYGHLWTVWHKYRVQHPQLDRYLMDWMLDLNAYYEIGMDSLDIIRSSAGSANALFSPDLVIATLISPKRGVVPSVDQLAMIANFHPKSGKFYREFQDKDLIDRTLQLGFKTLDDYYWETAQVGVIQAHQPKRNLKVTHTSFAGALFDYRPKQLLIAEVPAYSGLSKFPKLVEDVLKLSENILRKQVSFGGQRRGIELPPAIEERIRAALGDSGSEPVELRRERRKVVIDSSLTELLKQQSVEIRAELIASMQTDATSPPASARFNLPADRGHGDLTDVDSVANVLDKLGVADLHLLQELRQGGWESKARDPDRVELVNRLAHVELGDYLLVIESERLLVADDYRDELAFLLEHPDYAVLEAQLSGANKSDETVWSALFGAMNAVQLAALRLVSAGATMAEFDAFAHDHSSMGALLLDEINELALEHIGDNLVEDDGVQVTVYEDYLNDVIGLLEG